MGNGVEREAASAGGRMATPELVGRTVVTKHVVSALFHSDEWEVEPRRLTVSSTSYLGSPDTNGTHILAPA